MAEPQDMLRELSAITAQVTKLDQRRAPLRARAAELVVAILKADVPPSTVAEHSPFSAAHIRNLARIAGLPPARRGRHTNDAEA